MDGHKQHWRELWHRAADGEALSAAEQAELEAALQDGQAQRETRRWERAADTLRSLPRPDLPTSLVVAAWQDRTLHQRLNASPPGLPRSLAAELARDIALSRILTPPVAAPPSIAASLAARVAAEVPQRPQHPQDDLPALGRTRLNPPGGPSALGGLGLLLVFGGLTALRGNESAQRALGLADLSTSGGLLPWPTVVGVALLAVLSWLLVMRPDPGPALRRSGALAFSVLGVLTLPAVWDALQSLPIQQYLSPLAPLLSGRALGAGTLIVTLLLLRGGRGARLARRQRHAPLQTLAAGTLAGLGLGGLGLLLISFGWAGAGWGLAIISTLAALLGLSISMYAAGRVATRRLHLAFPEVSSALAGLLAFSASLSIPALAAGLAILGSAWGLGTLLLGRVARA